MREWIKKPFNLDPNPLVVTLQDTTCPIKGKGAKVTVPTFPAQPPVRSKMIHQHERDVEYFRVDKGKNKRKRESPKQVDLEYEEPQDEEVTQAHETKQIPPPDTKQDHEEEIE